NSVVMSMDWSVFEEAVEERPSLLEDLLSSDAADAAGASTAAEDIISRLGTTPAGDRADVLGSFLAEQVQAVLRLPKAPSPTVGFFDLGMDSLMAVELRNRLNRAFDGEYVASNTIVFDYPDIESMSRHLADELGQLSTVGEAPPAPDIPEPEPPVPVRSGEDGIAVVGMACRFPGASDLAAFWDLLEDGVDAVTDGRQDAGSWSGAVGDPDAEDVAYRRGAFVDGIDWFDSRFFRISPIEAQLMDPQQRMLLETTWQALEDAGMDPDGLKGSRTGVYAGIGSSEYRDLIAAGNRADSYLGTTGSVAVGRIAFALGLEGPAMPVDMACASSLAAVHQAVVGLQRGEVDMALAGGVNVVLSPPISRFMMDVGMLSPTGRCSPFDASADGYVRGEGCGMVVLKRLSDAEADGDRIWAVIRGSAVNQNGASAGLTVPNGPAQERIMREALTQAGVAPARVDYLESHATGSQLGDPIELNAAAAVYGDGRRGDRPLLVGSVKSNIGHAEWAAGIAAFIKTVLSMSQGVIPPLLHVQDPNPHVEWDRIPVRVATEKTAWPTDSGHPPLAGVNAFGLSGTNAHVLVEGYESGPDALTASETTDRPAGSPQAVPVNLPEAVAGFSVSEAGQRGARLLPLSGRSPGAVRDLARRYVSWLDGREGPASDALLSDLAWTAGTGRSHFAHRAGLVFADADQLRQGLRRLAGSYEAPGGGARDGTTRVAFAYTGHDRRWMAAGEALYQTEPVARTVLERCGEALEGTLDVSLLEVIAGRPGASQHLNDPALVQPLSYALACALTAQWASIGVRPSAVVGNGPPGLAAAQAAGVLSLEEGLRLAAELGTRLRPGPGWDAQAALDGLEAAVGGLALSPPSISLVGGAAGRVLGSVDELDLAGWLRQAGGPAGLSGCAGTLAGIGTDVVVVIGPDPTQGRTIREAWPETGAAPTVLSTLVGSGGDAAAAETDGGFLSAVSDAYEAGVDISFAGLFAGEVRRRISLPGYPFQRRRHWI
ncbi:MAG: beta-ketoacyl synthase N-terminal-like domain-containing protein, partial [bacterium]|nr:beta-ketoacyl synthase N-terminal-like domain-containing protein [bacterium]